MMKADGKCANICVSVLRELALSPRVGKVDWHWILYPDRTHFSVLSLGDDAS